MHNNRSFWIYHYPERPSDTVSRHTYIYLLDGETLFKKAMKALRCIDPTANRQYHLVLLGNKESRVHDYTFEQSQQAPFLSARELQATGGGEDFAMFLERELIPAVEGADMASHERCIIGHSLGGLEALHMLIRHGQLFNACIAIEPSVWFKQSKILRKFNSFLHSKRNIATRLFVAAANNRSKRKHTVLPLRQLVHTLRQNKHKINSRTVYYKHLQHFSVVPAAMVEAIRWLARTEKHTL